MTKGLILFVWGSMFSAIVGLGMILLHGNDALLYLAFVFLTTLISLFVAMYYVLKN